MSRPTKRRRNPTVRGGYKKGGVYGDEKLDRDGNKAFPRLLAASRKRSRANGVENEEEAGPSRTC
jgi:hypothetical protein